jgi:NAD(P)-dependent dehydrogenase (short-subunit alcohol dehydrogenase family)
MTQTAFITGGSKGIGFGIVKALLEDGFQVAFTGRDQEALDRAMADLPADQQNRALSLTADVQDRNALNEAFNTTRATFGSPSLVVANAGIGAFGDVSEMDASDWDAVIGINLTGAFNTLQAGVNDLKREQGLFITIGSLAGTNFFAGGAAYNASKFGLLGFSQAAMLDLRPHGVRVSTIMPGSVSTHFNGHTPSDADAWKIQPEDIADLVRTLVNMPARTLPSKIEVRPSQPGGSK